MCAAARPAAPAAPAAPNRAPTSARVRRPFDSNAGKKVGVEVWRIEKLEPARVEEKLHGKFYSGDCYIVLKARAAACMRAHRVHRTRLRAAPPRSVRDPRIANSRVPAGAC
jgi:hypothetical protein